MRSRVKCQLVKVTVEIMGVETKPFSGVSGIQVRLLEHILSWEAAQGAVWPGSSSREQAAHTTSVPQLFLQETDPGCCCYGFQTYKYN